jgi:hypothetical protein
MKAIQKLRMARPLLLRLWVRLFGMVMEICEALRIEMRLVAQFAR